ncbi:MAG: hypothetical protein KAI62_00195, partial [Actinomycetia bacterium]|nr:hypothetical protein [Actinomycetes bacterium]
MFSKLTKLLKAGEGKKLRKYDALITAVNNLEQEISKLSDDNLAGMTAALRQRYDNGQELTALMPEAFAVVRETAKRIIGMRHFDIQIMG